MSVIDFPNTPVLNQSFAAGNGATYKWNGTMWITVPSGGGGSGNVVGPATSTDNAIARYDGTTGKLLQDSWVTVSDTGVINGTFATFSSTVTANTGVLNGLIYGPLAATGTNAGFGGDGTNVGIRTYSGGGLYFQGPAGIPTWGYFNSGAFNLLTPLIGTTATFSGNVSINRAGALPAPQPLVVHAGTNQNLELRGGVTVPTAFALNAVNDLQNAVVPLEINAASVKFDCDVAVPGLSVAVVNVSGAVGIGGALTGTTAVFIGNINGVHTGVEIRNENAGDNAIARLLFNLSGVPNGYGLIEASNNGVNPGQVAYTAGAGLPLGHVFNKKMTLYTDVDADAQGALWIRGTGQNSNNPTTATAQQATLNIESANVAPGTGGMIKFSMLGGSGYAAIKGQGVNGGGNTQGGIGFSTRRVDTDTTLTEAMRIEYTGAVVCSNAGLTVLGNFHGITANLDQLVEVGYAGIGRIAMRPGGAINTGYLEFMQADYTRAAYIGYGVTSTGGIAYQLDKPGAHNFGGGPILAERISIAQPAMNNVMLSIKGTTTGANWLIYGNDSASAFKFGVTDGGTILGKALQIDGATYGASIAGAFSVADGAISGLFAGQSKGVRIINTATGSQIEGVDNSGGISYQPLTFGGSEVNAPTPPAADNSTKIATTAWVRANGGVTAIGTTPPASPTNGQLWWNSDGNVSGGGNLYVNYNDGNTTQWIVAAVGAPGPQGPPGAWVQMTQSAYDALPTKNATTLYVIVG